MEGKVIFMLCHKKVGQNLKVKTAIKYFKNVAESKVFGNDINKFAIIFSFNPLALEMDIYIVARHLCKM